MKTKILSLLIALALALPSFALPDVEMLHIAKVVTTAGTPVQLTTTRTHASIIVIQAYKAVGTANTATVYVGGAGAAGTQKLHIPTGQSISITPRHGTNYDLSKIWIDSATNGDGIIVTYLP